jgi:perosamine synthetase
MKTHYRSSSLIPVNTPKLDGNEKKYLSECIDTNWISSEGPFVHKFEQKFAEMVNRKFAISVSNGTSAIDIAVESLGIGLGDEVILPSFTIISCIGQIVRSGATPVLVDSDPLTFNMDINQIEKKISPKTKAIMVVHIYGLPVDIDPILNLAAKYNLKIIEDAAEMIGQTYKGSPCGSFGDISTFSFYPNKHITTGEGGMVVTNNSELAEDIKSLRNLCFDNNKRFVHHRLGWNYRMSNLQAAIGFAQLESLDLFVKRKREIGMMYMDLLSDVDNLQLPVVSTSYADNIFWVFSLVLKREKQSASHVIKKLSESGVQCRPFFYPMNKQPILKEMGFFNDTTYPVAEKIYDKGFYIPSGIGLLNSEIEIVAQKVKEALL